MQNKWFSCTVYLALDLPCSVQKILDFVVQIAALSEVSFGLQVIMNLSFEQDLLSSREDGSHTLITSHGGTIKEIMDTLYLTGKVAGLPEVTSRPKNTAITQLTLNLDPAAQTNILSGKCTRYYDADHLAHFWMIW